MLPKSFKLAPVRSLLPIAGFLFFDASGGESYTQQVIYWPRLSYYGVSL